MSHLSIAIIRKRSVDIDTGVYEYLAQTNESGELSFFDSKNQSIGGGFDFGTLRRQIIDYFELQFVDGGSESNIFKTGKKTLNDFESHKLFRINKRDPFATAYQFTLNEEQIDSINFSIQTNNDVKWKNLKWYSSEELKSNISKWKNDQKFIFKERSIFEKTKFPNELRASLRNIAKARDNGKLVIFAGAGVSVDSNLPTWRKLIEGLANDLDKDFTDSLQLAQIYFEARGKKEYQEKIQEILKHGNTRNNSIHDKVIEISPSYILTTNYDTHFEQVIQDKGYKYSVVKKDSDLPYTKGSSLLIKMHGDFDERNIVLNTDDYNNYSETFPLIEGFIKGLFASKLVMFIGFSFEDPNLKGIYNSVKKILKKDTQPPYFITSSSDEVTKQLFENDFDLKVIDIGDSDNKRSIEYYFDKESNNYDKEGYEKLSLHGKGLFRFLEVVKTFNVISDSFEGLNTETLLTSSISRFEEFGAIPQKVLERIPPFSEIGGSSEGKTILKAELHVNKYLNLETPNEALLKFLKQRKDSEIGIEFYSYKNDTDSNSKQEIDKCFKLLHMSMVRNITRKDDVTRSDDNTKEVYKLIPKNLEPCNCKRCLFDKLDFGTMLIELANLSNKLICNQSSADLGLSEAFGFYRTGQFVKAFHTLEEVRNVSWRQKKFATFFIASYNQKLLRSFLWYSDCKDSIELELENLKSKIDRLDLDELLSELPLDKEVKYALTLIKDDEAYKRANAKINKNHKTILEIYEKYSKGEYRHSGQYYWHIVEQEHYILWNFYHKNLLFSDLYVPYIELTEKYLESMIASYKTSTEYEEGLSKISGYFLTTAVLYSHPKFIESLFIKYDIREMEILNSEEQLPFFIEKFKTYVHSGFIESNFFGHSLFENRIYSNALENSSTFQGQTENILNNYFVLFSRIKLNENAANEILNWGINYIQINIGFKTYRPLEYFERFFIEHILIISKENIVKTLTMMINNQGRSEFSYQAICSAIFNKKELKNFLDDKFYILLLKRFFEIGDAENQKKDLFAFFPLLETKSQKSFYKEITKILLLERSNNVLISTAYYWGIWNPSNNKKIFNQLSHNIKNRCGAFQDYKISEDGLPIGILSFSIWNDLINLTLIVYRYNLFNNENVKEIRQKIPSKMFRWALNPLESDLNHFDSSWLYTFQSDDHLKILKQSNLLCEKLKTELQQNFNPILAEIYFKLIKD